MRSTNTSGFPGVSLHKRIGLYQSRITENGARVHLGYFETAEQAGIAYLREAIRIRGDFAMVTASPILLALMGKADTDPSSPIA
jgi:hypothetical protein